MILLQPGTANQSIDVFIQESHTDYVLKAINESTKQVDQFTITGNTSDGVLTYLLPIQPVKNTFYTLLVLNNDVVMNNSMAYCGDSLDQPYRRLDDVYNQPAASPPIYKVP